MGLDDIGREDGRRRRVQINDGIKMKASPIMALPAEIWESIFKNLLMVDAKKVRLVCQAWKAEVESHYDKWCISLNHAYGYQNTIPTFTNRTSIRATRNFNTSEDFKLSKCYNLLDFRVKEVNILLLSTLQPLRFKGRLLKYPDHLEKLVLNNRYQMEKRDRCGIAGSETSCFPENLHVLLDAKNLKELHLCLNSTLLNSPYYDAGGQLISYNYQHLKELNIIFEKKSNENRADLITNNLFHQILMVAKMPNLSSLTVAIGELNLKSDNVDNILSTLVSFLAKHGRSLRNLTIIVCPTHMWGFDEVHYQQLNLIDTSHLKNACYLQCIEVVLNMHKDSFQDIWTVLLGCQRKLYHMDVHRLPISAKLFRHIVMHNFETLTSIKVGPLVGLERIADEDYLDLSFLQSCRKLKDLKIRIREDEYFKWDDSFHLNVQNLIKLPKNIQTLNLDATASTVDLVGFLSNPRRKLRTLILTLNERINSSVLEAIMLNNMNNLQRVRIEGTNPEDPAELINLKVIFDSFGYTPPDDDYIFEMRKDPVILTWSLESVNCYDDFSDRVMVME